MEHFLTILYNTVVIRNVYSHRLGATSQLNAVVLKDDWRISIRNRQNWNTVNNDTWKNYKGPFFFIRTHCTTAERQINTIIGDRMVTWRAPAATVSQRETMWPDRPTREETGNGSVATLGHIEVVRCVNRVNNIVRKSTGAQPFTVHV